MSSGLGAGTHKEQLVVSPNRRAELCSGAPSREQTSKARTYEQIRAHKSKHVSEWPGDQVRREETREGFGLFFAWVGKAWARYYEQVGEFLDTFLALLALFLASSFHGPFFWLSHSWFVMSCECVSWWGLGVRGYTQADKLSRKCFHIVVKPGLHHFSPNLVSFQFEINHKWKFKLGDLESNIWLSSLLWRIGKISHMRSKCGPRRVLL